MNRILTAAALAVLSLAACKKDEPAPAGAPPAAKPEAQKEAAPAAAAPAAPAGTKVGDLPVVADIPAGAEANGGMPGFHSEDGSVYVIIKAAADTDPADIDAAKKSVEESGLFKKWGKTEKSADGWSMSWTGVSIDMEGKEGENTPFSVRRKIGETSYECYGSVKKADDLEKNLKLCNSLRAEL